MAKILIILAAAAVAYGSPSFVPAVAPAEEIVAQPVAQPIARFPSSEYKYSYSVHDGLTGDIKNQVERRDGDVVQGSYSLLEADGFTKRVVDYSADALNGFNAVVRNEPALRAEVAVAAPAVRTEHVAVAAPAVRTEHVAVAPAVPVAAPIVRSEPVATVAYSAPHVAPAVRTDIAYAPVQRTHVAVTPVVKTEAYQPPPAVSSQSVTHTSHTLHPQPIQYRNHVENVASVQHTVSHEPVAAITRAEIPLAPAYQTRVAVAPAVRAETIVPAVRAETIVPAIHTPITNSLFYKTYPTYPAYNNFYYH